MNRTDFRLRLAQLDLDVMGFAALTGVHHTTARNWGKFSPYPKWVDLLLTAWEHLLVYDAYKRGGV